MSIPKRITIVTSGNPCRNPRPVKEAICLSEAGYNVTLLSPQGDASLAETDRGLFINKNLRHIVAKSPHPQIARCIRRLSRELVRLGFENVRALDNPTPLIQELSKYHSDLVIVHNEMPHWIGCRLIDLGQKVAADIEDWHSEDLLPTARCCRPMNLLRLSENTLLRRAIYTTTTSNSLSAELFKTYGGQRANVITNSFPLQSDPHISGPSNVPILFWFSQTLGPGRGLEQFIESWRLITVPCKLVLLGSPINEFLDKLFKSLAPGQKNSITCLPLVSPSQLPSIIARYDVGLALDTISPRNRDLTITNKILQYLNAGLAIIANRTSGHLEVFSKQPEAGIIVDLSDPVTASHEISAMLLNRRRLESQQAASRRLAETQYCWEVEAPRLLSLVKCALS